MVTSPASFHAKASRVAALSRDKTGEDALFDTEAALPAETHHRPLGGPFPLPFSHRRRAPRASGGPCDGDGPDPRTSLATTPSDHEHLETSPTLERSELRPRQTR